MDPLPERRRASRVQTALTARLIRPDGSACALEVEGLSLVGLHGRSAAPVARDLACRIELLTDTGGIDVRGTVVRSLECELAIRFDYLPFEGFERLKAFLLANARDPAVIADELTERLGYLEESA